jgi:hypothetical protein
MSEISCVSANSKRKALRFGLCVLADLGYGVARDEELVE